MSKNTTQYFCIVYNDFPLYEIEYSPQIGTQSATFNVPSTSIMQLKDENRHMNQFVAYAAQDTVDEMMWQTPNTYLKVVDRFNELMCSAYVLPSNVRFLLLHDSKNEDGIKQFFLEIHEMYIKTLLNPFYQPVLPGDNIGPEVTKEAVKVLNVVLGLRSKRYGLDVRIVEADFGGAAIDQCDGVPYPQKTHALINQPETVAVLLGAIGGPQWDDANVRPEKGLLELRKQLQVFANIRPCKFPSESLLEASPLKPELAKGVDFIIVRELCSGIYFGESSRGDDYAEDTCRYSVEEIKRVARIACKLAMQRPEKQLLLVDKANVLETSKLWRRVVSDLVKNEFPDLRLSFQYVDAAAMLMIKNPRLFNGVVLTSNLFGDILSDESSVIPGSLGLLPSASLKSLDHRVSIGLYEPIHGSAPDIAGQNVANPIGAILSVALLLRYSLGWDLEAKCVEDAVERVLDTVEFGGFGLRTRDLGGISKTGEIGDKVCEVLRESLGSLCAQEFNSTLKPNITIETKEKRGLNLCEKILLSHAVGDLSEVKPGDLICVNVDWTLASELTWKGMEKTFNEMNRPPVFRNDRFWLAIDHTVDPSINNEPKPRELIRASEKFAKEAQIKDFYGPNQTILHTEFYRERAQPGQIIIGADSHSCSAGGLGAFAVGLGAADVVMPLVTGQTWFKVPETVEIKFIGRPPVGIGGKDVILWILGELKRNTVAFERAVEFTGPGCRHLSCDARFAIANMATEFGAIAGVFQPDELTAAYVNKRKNAEFKSESVYFKADKNAEYSQTCVIDLSKIESLVALYPSPDNVVPVSRVEGMQLDGVFIGACTTAEEDLILAALVLQQGLQNGFRPSINGKRKVTPGSVSIMAKLKQLGLIEIYQQAGFEIGAPGCSYCLGIAADKAGEGEVWLSSQNRNFKNRMGKGSIGNIASAATVAASSFDMRITDPKHLLSLVDRQEFKKMLNCWGALADDSELSQVPCEFQITFSDPSSFVKHSLSDEILPPPPENRVTNISGLVQKFGDNIDTDAIIPAEFMPGTSNEDLGSHCFQYVRPEFRERAAQGYSVVVAGCGFGSGSSREEAPRALLGCGIQLVCAESFAFIYHRNQSNMALLGITPQPWKEFYDFVGEGSKVTVDLSTREVLVSSNSGESRRFKFELSKMEERLLAGGGVTQMYKRYGKNLFKVAMSSGFVSVKEIVSDHKPLISDRKIGGLAGFIPKLSKKFQKKSHQDQCVNQSETNW